MVVQLKKSLDLGKVEQAKQLELLDQEGRITSELTALGAQCRGERHEQVRNWDYIHSYLWCNLYCGFCRLA